MILGPELGAVGMADVVMLARASQQAGPTALTEHVAAAAHLEMSTTGFNVFVYLNISKKKFIFF